MDFPAAGAVAAEGEGDKVLDFLLGKESPAKKTSKKIEMEVNSISIFDYDKIIPLELFWES